MSDHDSPDKLNTLVEDVADALARRYPPPTKEPCNDCPWRREATRGWLGPFDAVDWLASIHGEAAIACHQTIPEGGGWSEQTRQCRGAAMFRAHVCKNPHNATIETGPDDREQVFATNQEFYDHHDGSLDFEDLRQLISERMYG